MDGIKRIILRKAEITPKGEWIRGIGYDDTKTTDAGFLNKQGSGFRNNRPRCALV
jgi:hypothetical protein